MRSPIRAAILVALVTVAAFWNSFEGAFVFDDGLHIVENPRVRLLTPPWAPLLGTTRPLIQGSMALNYAMGGLDPWGYHAVNLGLHLGGALLLFGLLRRLFERFTATRDAATGLAMTVAALWAVHPLQTESVTYVIQRAEVGMGLCVLLTLYSLLRASESPRPGRWLALSLGSCLIGFGFKPIMAMTPLLAWVFDRAFIGGGFGAAFRARRSYYIALASTPAVLPLLLAGSVAEWKTTAGFACRDVSWSDYAATQPEVILHYLKLSFWPDTLCLDYGWPVQHSILVIALTSTIILSLVALTVYGMRRAPAWGFLGAWFFINLAPTSSFVPISDLAFEHRIYLALAAVICAAVIAAHWAMTRFLPAARSLVAPATAAAVIALYASFTVARNADYHSELRIATTNVLAAPGNPRAHGNLGRQLALFGNLDGACREFKKAIELKPDYAMAYANYGQALLDKGEPGRAQDFLEKATELKPEDWTAHNKLGMARFRVGQDQKAATSFQSALRLCPESAEVHFNMATALRRAGDLKQSIAHLEEAVRLAPDWSDPKTALNAMRGGS
jgi:tetratricopeptide (TPR) repeat protein